MKTTIVALGFLSLAAAPLGCADQDCTLAGCINSATFRFEPDGDRLPVGELEYVLTLDDAELRATCDEQVQCGAFEGDTTPLTLAVNGSALGMSIEVTANDPAEMPESYRVQLLVDGEVLVDESGTLEYQTFEPNGPDCGPTCAFTDGPTFTVPPEA